MPHRQPVLRRSTLRATCLRLLTKPLWPKHRPRAIIRPLNRQKHVARRRVRCNTRRERSPKAGSMHVCGPDGTHFCLSGYARSRERRTSLIRATCFRDQGRVSPSGIMLNRRSAFSRQGAAAEVRSPSDQSAHPSSPNVARRPKVCRLSLRFRDKDLALGMKTHLWPTKPSFPLTRSSPHRCRRSKGPRCGQQQTAARAGNRCRIPFPAIRRVPLCPGPHGQKPRAAGNPPP